MRTGSCAVQQGLTAEAATVVKQAVTLAKRRGHAQVTPLHVANTMLAASNGLLRTACLQSHSHPLQCKALELCFNVALNRLPASNSSSPMLGPPAHSPSISNAMVAAFKRAQAHQRRGSIENQQQPLLAVKIELEQLIISILDDPSVSRVMREAGFSSTQVKSNVEQAVSLEVCSQNAPSPSASGKSKENETNNNITTKVGKTMGSGSAVREEDVTGVLDYLRNQRMRSSVLVGECLASLEGVVRRVMEKVEKGNVDDEGMRDVKFISLSLSAFGHVSRVQVENKIEELRNSAKSNCHSKGFILYVGDINWVFEYRAGSRQQGRGYYCPVEHMILEIGRLISGIGENGRFCVMGIATFQTYMRCRNGYPSLQTVWGLHPFTIPVGNLSLSLIADSGLQNEPTKKTDNGSSWRSTEGDKEKSPDCLAEPSSVIFDIRVRSLPSSTCNSDSSTSSLPAWLQQCKSESKGVTSDDQDCVVVRQKWNSACNSNQIPPCSTEKTLTFSSVSPSSSTSFDHPNFWFSSPSANSNKPNEPTLKIYIPEHKDIKQTFLPSNPNSTSSSDVMETEYVSRFRELNSENLKTLCEGLQRKVPWQKDVIPTIVSTILQCRSGMLKRKGRVKNVSEVKEETWLLFQGADVEAKENIARELARLVFGSHRNLVSVTLSSFSSIRADSTEDYCRNKRSRDEQSCSYIDKFADAVSSNPHTVFLVEDIEQVDYRSQLAFKRVIERGRITGTTGEEVRLSDAIIILSCESFSSRSRACSPPVKQKSCEEKNEAASLEETSSRVSLDLNISIDDDDGCEKDKSVDDIGLLELVDRRIIFKIQEL